MNRENIIRMAAESGVSPVNDQQIKFEGPMWLCLERFANLVAAHEREACLALVNQGTGEATSADALKILRMERDRISVAIRARGET